MYPTQSMMHPISAFNFVVHGYKTAIFALLGLLLMLWFAPLCANPSMVPSSGTIKPHESAEPSAEQVKSLIATLENDQSRAKLLNQLHLLIKTQEKTQQPDAGDATAEVLRDLSKSTVGLIDQFILAAGGINQLPEIADWLQKQAFDPAKRQVWVRTLLNLALILTTSYLTLFLLQFGLRKPRRLITEKSREKWWVRLSMVLLTSLLDLIPLTGFGVTGYLSLGLVNPAEPTRLVALAWINAILLVRLLQLIGRVVFCADTPNLRLGRLDDESAHYAEIWIRRLAGVGVYGYFLIQSAHFLGLPQFAFSALMHLLGLLMTALLLVLILQNRGTVARWIRGPHGTTGAMHRLRAHLGILERKVSLQLSQIFKQPV